MAEVTDEGYVLKPQNEWFQDEEDRYKEIDPDWNLDPSTPDGIKLATDSEIWANLDELGQKAYNSKDPSKAVENELDAISAITGTERSEGTFSTSSVDLVGTNGTIILAGSFIDSTENGSRWTIDVDTVIAGVTAAAITATERGDIQASIATITKIVNPQAGWESASNPAVAVVGDNPDTDAELRIKRDSGVALPGQNQVDSTFAAINNLDGVKWVRIYENDDTAPFDANGLPIFSTAILVDGGVDADIALAIYNKRNPGVIQHELTTPVIVPITSPETGNQKDIKFNRPDYVDIIVAYEVTDDGTLPANIEQLIKDATLDYVNGELLDADDGFNQSGFTIGEDVHASRFYTPVNKIIGQYGDSYVTAITVNAGASVVISFEELSRFTDANITVNVT